MTDLLPRLDEQIDSLFRGGLDTLDIARRLDMTEPAVVSCLARFRAEKAATKDADFWTQDRMERLCKMWAARLPVGMIADTLGTTRNACLGKASRLGLPRMTDGSERPRSGIAHRVMRERRDIEPMLNPHARPIEHDDEGPSPEELKRASAGFLKALRREQGRAVA